jgi:hypothetical protein
MKLFCLALPAIGKQILAQLHNGKNDQISHNRTGPAHYWQLLQSLIKRCSHLRRQFGPSEKSL